ncbi:MAG: UDP-glucose 4-epimerase GalE [Acidobacteria bacterium]|nr:UDP-glucose 4-epimerase GalE [Acidobacteriota bacterium]
MSVLVTGGAGYVGSHVSQRLAASGFRPIVFDNLSRGHRRAVRWGPLIEGDLADQSQIIDAIRRYNVEAVVHLAAYAYVGESVADPASYYRNNLANSLNLLEAMRRTGVSRIVFSSTCATYGVPQSPTIDERHPQAPVNPYGESKLAVEKMLRWFGEAYGLRWTALRYFNAAGADPNGETGECHHPETHLIPLALDAASPDGPPLRVFGLDYDTCDGSAERDYVHVSDLAEAHAGALARLRSGHPSIALNLGTGRGATVLEIIRAVEAVAGRPLAWEAHPRRPGDPPSLVANPALARKVLAWSPRHSSLREIVASAWAWRDSERRRILASAHPAA